MLTHIFLTFGSDSGSTVSAEDQIIQLLLNGQYDQAQDQALKSTFESSKPIAIDVPSSSEKRHSLTA